MQESWNPSVLELRTLFALNAELEITSSHADFDETKEYRCYAGNILHHSPSGKLYVPWSTNVTQEEADADEEWRNQLDKTAKEAGLYFTAGEGDSCDMILCGDPEAYAAAWKTIYKEKVSKLEDIQKKLTHIIAIHPDERMAKVRELYNEVTTKRE